MGFSKKVKYFLVHAAGMSNRQAQELIDAGKVRVDGRTISEDELLDGTSEVAVGETIVRAAKKFVYYRFYKPRGYESTLSPKVNDNLAPFFPGAGGLAIAGRLDKDSEGLLLLSDDGKWVQFVTDPMQAKEKEYLVRLHQPVTDDFLREFAAGKAIGSYQTRPCTCERVEPQLVRIVLREGRNRHIRRICRKLGYEVENLKRIRIGSIELGDLKPGEARKIKGL